MLEFVHAAIRQEGLVGHNIAGFDDLIDRGIPAILENLFSLSKRYPNERRLTEEDRRWVAFDMRVQFHSVQVGRPQRAARQSGLMCDLHPAQARLTGAPYSGVISLGATVTLRAHAAGGGVEEKAAEVPPFQIGSFPIMVGSNRCHTRGLTRAALKAMGEDPSDPGGAFIAKRGEWVVDLLENIRYNVPHIHRGMKPGELVRAEFISQAGGAFENSAQARVRLMTTGAITIEITSIKFEKVKIPFYVIYRLFGMTSDRDIAETVVFDAGAGDPVTLRLLRILKQAFHLADPKRVFEPLTYELDRERLVAATAERVAKLAAGARGGAGAYAASESAVQYLNEDLLGSPSRPGGLDVIFLPHVGKTGEARVRKLRLLGLVIRDMLLTHLGVLPPTGRDSYRNKRVHGAGVSLAKSFKTQVNNLIIKPLVKKLRMELQNTPWGSITPQGLVELFRASTVSAADLNQGMEQSITGGAKTIVVRRHAALNRVSTEALERKNPLNTISSLRGVVAQNAGNASKQTERAESMRSVHPSFVGFICVSQSADTGETVGMRKQLAVTAGVCAAGEALPLVLRLLADPAVTPLDAAPGREILRRRLARVFVNGEWVGVCASAPELAARYRALRREGRGVDRFTSVVWNPVTDEVEFWLDVGRLRRPLLLVDNNLAEYDAACRAAAAHRRGGAPGPPPPRVPFRQNLRLTPAHARALAAGALTLAELVEGGVAEYVTPEEQENCLIAPSVGALFAAAGDVTLRYTHVDVEQAIFGFAAMISPYGNHTQPARVTFETNQGRQTGGWYALNFPFRADKLRFFQWGCEVPLVRTLTYDHVAPNGVNVVIAYAPYGGDNQEDSVVVNQAAADRGLFAGAFFRYELVELEKDESFATPDALTTKNFHKSASFEKLVGGFVRPGSVVREGDVLVGRVARLRPPPGAPPDPNGFTHTDRSIVYRLAEPAVVEEVLHLRGPKDEPFVVVKLRYDRPLRVGDKISSRSGNKTIVAALLPQGDMPFTEDGLTPDLIVNTASFPSRMIIGQLVEGTAARAAAHRGAPVDGTPFLPVDLGRMAQDLLGAGARFNGRTRLYNGLTGEYFSAAIFMAPCAEQRLQKFVLDDEQAVGGSGPTDATTGQPLGGKRVMGGLRMGEMEVQALESHGSMRTLFEKVSTDSDGRTVVVCRGCGGPGVFNGFRRIFACRTCGDLADLAEVESCKSATLLLEELAASNIQMLRGLRPRAFERGAGGEPDPTDAGSVADTESGSLAGPEPLEDPVEDDPGAPEAAPSPGRLAPVAEADEDEEGSDAAE
jgi:DNA-directed RNA polymerase beta subunit